MVKIKQSSLIIQLNRSDGLMSPTRRVSTSLLDRQERRKSEASSKEKPKSSHENATPAAPTALDLHPSAVSEIFILKGNKIIVLILENYTRTYRYQIRFLNVSDFINVSL